MHLIFLSSFYYQIQSVVYIHLTIPSNGICFINYWTAPHKEKSSSSTVAARPYRDTQKLSPRFPRYLKSTCHKQLSPLLSLPKVYFLYLWNQRNTDASVSKLQEKMSVAFFVCPRPVFLMAVGDKRNVRCLTSQIYFKTLFCCFQVSSFIRLCLQDISLLCFVWLREVLSGLRARTLLVQYH